MAFKEFLINIELMQISRSSPCPIYQRAKGLRDVKLVSKTDYMSQLFHRYAEMTLQVSASFLIKVQNILLLNILLRAYNLIIKSNTRSLNIFKKPNTMINFG